MNWLKKLIARYRHWKREREVIDTCGCVTYCPHCGDILNDNSEWRSGDDSTGTYRCKACDGVSTWYFGAPVPILVPPNAPHEGPGGFSPGPLDAVVGRQRKE